MTNGTSQGLFVVVAIVIFGIFIGLSYTLFGSEGLTKDLKGLFENGTEQAIKTVENRPNLIDINQMKSFTDYNSEPVVKGKSLTVIRTGKNALVAIAVNSLDKTPKVGYTYTISGYMYLNGKPVTNKDWIYKQATTYQVADKFHVDDKTGYFESTQTWKYSSHMQYILHTGIGKVGIAGDNLTIKNLKVEEGAYATNR